MRKTDERVVFINAKKYLDEDTKLLMGALEKHFKNLETVVTDSHKVIIDKIADRPEMIDVVILDHAVFHGIDLIHKILQIDNSLQMLVISGSAYCSEVNGCEYCQENYKKIRLLKPVVIKDVVKHIRDFSHYRCEYKQKCEELYSKRA